MRQPRRLLRIVALSTALVAQACSPRAPEGPPTSTVVVGAMNLGTDRGEPFAGGWEAVRLPALRAILAQRADAWAFRGVGFAQLGDLDCSLGGEHEVDFFPTGPGLGMVVATRFDRLSVDEWSGGRLPGGFADGSSAELDGRGRLFVEVSDAAEGARVALDRGEPAVVAGRFDLVGLVNISAGGERIAGTPDLEPLRAWSVEAGPLAAELVEVEIR